MKRIFVVSASALALAGCASWPGSDMFSQRPAPSTNVELRLDSSPPGAEARTSTGQACTTPCVLTLPPANLSVTFSLKGYETQTVQVAGRMPGDSRYDPNAISSAQFDPNPVFVELAPAPRPVKKRPVKRKPRPKTAPQAGTPHSASTPPSPPPAQTPPPDNTPPPGSPWPPITR